MVLGETTFATLGILFLLTSIRTFTSTLYMTLYGAASNETVGAIALGVFAASLLAAVMGWRMTPRRAIAFSGALLAGGTLLAAASRWNWADIALSAVAVVGGTWWLALTWSARGKSGGSPFVLGLPLAIAADLALRSAFRTVPVVDLAPLLAIALVAVAALVFAGAGIAVHAGEHAWTSPGPRGWVALLAMPSLLLVGELGATQPGVAALAGGLARGPEPPGIWYVAAAALGVGMTSGTVALARGTPPRRMVGLGAVVAGAVLFWSHLPIVATLGSVVLVAGLVIAASVIADTAARPAASPLVAALALGLGWTLFAGVAFAFYAYYALPAAAWIATGIVALGLVAAMPLPGPRVGAAAVILMAVLTIAVPAAARVVTPSPTTEPRSSFRLMTYNIHQGFDDGNVPSLDRIAETIAAEAPDVVVLQEVVRGWMIGEQHDALTYLAERLAMTYVFRPSIGDAYGNAVLSRLPVSDVDFLPFERQALLRHQPRGAILFAVSGVLVMATHLDHVEGATEVRQAQVHALLAKWGSRRPAIVAGDLNALPGTAEIRLLEEAGFHDLARDGGADQPTFPASDPKNRIDYVWGIGVTGSQAHTVASTASDHRPLVVNVAAP